MTTMLDNVREVLKRDNVSFAELCREVPGFDGGDLDWSHNLNRNVIFWTGLTREACDAIQTILAEGEYRFDFATSYTYMMDGIGLNLPLLQRDQPTLTPHWLPVVFKRVSVTKGVEDTSNVTSPDDDEISVIQIQFPAQRRNPQQDH